MEQHVLQAKAKTLAAEEKIVATRAESSSYTENAGLPQEQCLLSQFLNEDLLAQYNLLIPSQYHPKIHVPRSPPKKTHPNYLKPTITFNMHATVPIDMQCLSYTNDSIQSRFKERNSYASQSGKSALKSQGRIGSAPNTRPYNAQIVTSIDQPKALKQSSYINSTNGNKRSEKLCFFVAEPNEIIFTNYQAKKTYELPLILRNTSSTSQQLRIIPPHTSYFSICIDHFPNPEGLIAPGMHCSYIVKFTPDSLADYTDHIEVMMRTGMSISVPLKGIRPAPILSLPCVLDCGFSLIGSVKTIDIDCSNNGGEGNFYFRVPNTEHASGNKVSPLQTGAFTITPVVFYLSSHNTQQIKLSFSPFKEGEHLEDIELVYDNCHIQCIQLRGTAQHVDIGHLSTRPCLTHEIIAFRSHKAEADSYVIESESYPESESISESHVVSFDPTNPGQAVFKTVIMKNFSNVDVEFQWKFYRPKTELPLSSHEESQELLIFSSEIESTNSVFSVKPKSGTFRARERKSFTFCFLSHKVDVFEDMAHFLVPNIPELCLKTSSKQSLVNGQLCAASIQLYGISEHYALEFVPPIISIPEGIPFAAEARKLFKIFNPSSSIVEYYWNSYIDSFMGSITVDPPSGVIVPGNCSHCELVISGMQEGLVSTSLMCSIKYSDVPLQLHIKIYVQPAVLYVDVPSLDFGLLSFGSSRILQLPIRSDSKAILQYELRQKISHSQDEKYMDCLCLSFNVSKGELQPYGKVCVVVECKPDRTGRLRSQLEILVGKKVIRCVEVRAEVQRPIVRLKKCLVHEQRAYIQTKIVKEVVLVNETYLPTQFTWSSQILGQSSKFCELQISPPTGRIGPLEALPLLVNAKWSVEGVHPEAIATCIVQGMEKPLFMCVSAEVFGTSVHYSVNDGITENLSLDFGTINSLRKASTMFLKVTNTSAIQTSLGLRIVHFPASKPPTPPTITQIPDCHTPRRNKQLLQKTMNICDSSSKSKGQIASDYAQALLREGRGVCFLIDPPSAELPPFETKTVAVTAYSDMWGEYKDELVCEVKGLAAVTIPIKYEVMGCPVTFQTTASVGQTIIRFGNHSVDSSPIHRVIKLKNSSPFEIRIDWEMFNNIQDDKLLDLVHFCGNPFPRQNASLMMTEEGNSFSDDSSTDCQLSFRVILKPHEGIRANGPFHIHPQQMVLPSHGQGVVDIVFHPTAATFHSLGTEVVSYALGYLSIDQPANKMVTRPTGYDVEPLRINITAGITHPMLSLESDDEDGLYFIYPASIFIQDNQTVERIVKKHHFVLKNTSITDICFQIENESKAHFIVSTASCRLKNNFIVLKPNESIAVIVLFTLSFVDFKDKCRCHETVCFTEKIVALFSNGLKQDFELSIKIILPTLVLSSTHVEFGTVFLGRSCESDVFLFNSSLSDALWSLHIPSEFQHILSANPKSGIVVANQSVGTEAIHFSFSPSSEGIYKCAVFLRNETTGAIHQINLTGTGSANEKFSDTWWYT